MFPNPIPKSWLLLLLLTLGVVAAGRWLRSGDTPPGVAPLRIGVVRLTAVDDRTLAGFREGMARLGHAEGAQVRYLAGPPAGSVEAARTQLLGLLNEEVTALLVSSTPVTRLAQELTRERGTPVVFAPVNDPVAAGVVANLREPGGNLTGIRLPLGDPLRLQWLRELAPQVRRVAVPFTRTDASAQTTLAQLREAAPLLGLELLELPLEDDATVATVAPLIPPADALFLPRDSRVEAQIGQWIDYARAHRQPLSAPSLLQVEQGALYSFGFSHREIGIQAARLMDQVLRGVPPGQLPVETADSFLGINLKAARDIGLEVPETVLRQAKLVVRPE